MANSKNSVSGSSSIDKRSDSLRSEPVVIESNQTDTYRSQSRPAGGKSSFLEGARSRPAIAAAAVTAVAAAGAYLWSKRSSSTGSQPLMRWGQSDSQATGSMGYDSATAASTFDTQSASSFDSAYAPELETASASPSSSAGIGAGTGGASPSDLQSSINSGMSGDFGSGGGSSSDLGSGSSSSLGGGTGTGSNIDSDLGGVGGSSGFAGSSSGSASSDLGSQTTDRGSTGLDEVSKSDTKSGSVAYGA